MMDAMGVLQHHDAVTGTGKQYVADTYNSILFKAMHQNNQVFASAMGESLLRTVSGLRTNRLWEWCYRENSTYLDCPIAEYEADKLNLVVAVYNPATDPTEQVSIAVPNGKVEVRVWN